MAAETASAQPMIEGARQFFDRNITASDGGDRRALASLRPYYDALYGQTYLEAAMNEQAAATAMVRELDKWLTERAQGGSPTAQFWMAERAGMRERYSEKSLDRPDAEILEWLKQQAAAGDVRA